MTTRDIIRLYIAGAQIAVGVFLVATAVPSCTHGPKPIHVETMRTQCIDQPPPEPPSEGGQISGPDQGCPAQFAACLDDGTLATVTTYLADLRRYAQQVWIACGSGDSE